MIFKLAHMFTDDNTNRKKKVTLNCDHLTCLSNWLHAWLMYMNLKITDKKSNNTIIVLMTETKPEAKRNDHINNGELEFGTKW